MSLPGDPPYEARLDIWLSAGNVNLLNRSMEFFSALTASAGVKILSHRRYESCRMFILSESSLIVHAARISILTCGVSRLHHCLTFLQSQDDFDGWERLQFEQRRSPDLLRSADSRLPQSVQHIVDILGPGSETTREEFSTTITYARPGSSGSRVQRLRLMAGEHESRLPSVVFKNLAAALGFPFSSMDEHEFSPPGYSLNCATNESLLTLHYTPGRYLSLDFEGIHSDIEKLLKGFTDAHFEHARLSLLISDS